MIKPQGWLGGNMTPTNFCQFCSTHKETPKNWRSFDHGGDGSCLQLLNGEYWSRLVPQEPAVGGHPGVSPGKWSSRFQAVSGRSQLRLQRASSWEHVETFCFCFCRVEVLSQAPFFLKKSQRNMQKLTISIAEGRRPSARQSCGKKDVNNLWTNPIFGLIIVRKCATLHLLKQFSSFTIYLPRSQAKRALPNSRLLWVLVSL